MTFLRSWNNCLGKIFRTGFCLRWVGPVSKVCETVVFTEIISVLIGTIKDTVNQHQDGFSVWGKQHANYGWGMHKTGRVDRWQFCDLQHWRYNSSIDSTNPSRMISMYLPTHKNANISGLRFFLINERIFYVIIIFTPLPHFPDRSMDEINCWVRFS